MFLKRLNGVRLPHMKKTACESPQRMPAPATVTIPLSMHIGGAALCAVKVGDKVKRGQVIGTPAGFVSAPVHSSVSGTVTKITEVLQLSGKTVAAVVIESDGLMTPDSTAVPPKVNDYESFIAAVAASGAVGLGGAGFPTHVKLSCDRSKIQEVIINGAECEPYITSDTRTMIDRAESIAYGCEALQRYMGVKKIFIAVEKNNPEAIAKMREIAEKDSAVSVFVLPSVYPQGGEKVVIYHITGKVVPEGKLPIDVGTLVINCTTLAFIADYIKTGMPLVEKCVTVDGSAIKEPKNVIAPIGTSFSDVIEFCGGYKSEPKKLIMGGPMMGVALYTADTPVIKQTNALLAFDESEAKSYETTNCIRCGRCSDHCPFRLDPTAFAKALKQKDPEKLSKLKINICMECGCCSYVCPTSQMLAQEIKLGKAMLQEWQLKNAEEAKKNRTAKEGEQK